MQKNNVTDYFSELEEIHFDETLSTNQKYTQLRNLLERITKDLTLNEVLQFSNLFSKLSFICDKYQVSRKIHSFRVTANKVTFQRTKPSIEEYLTHFKYFAEFISNVFKIAIPIQLKEQFPEIEYKKDSSDSETLRIDKVRASFIEIKDGYLICTIDDEKQENIKVVVDEIFSSSNNFWKGAQLFLVNVEIDKEDIYYPKFIILEPDYLVDISSIAECCQDHGISELHYLKSKFEAIPNTKHIRLGNFANLVVDELFTEKENNSITFEKTFEKDFKSYPFEYTTCSDIQEKDAFVQYWNDAKLHFDRIKRVVTEDFSKYGISIESASLEPAFLCDLYGIQGRLDILQLNKTKSKIIELKSGGVPFPDDGISIKPNHSTQLFLYYQLVSVVNQLNFNEITEKTDGYILYSKPLNNNLRFDKPTLNRIQRIFELRNQIICNEFILASDNIGATKSLVDKINSESLINAPNVNPNFRQNYLEPQINAVVNPIKKANELEKTYFYSFFNFIAKEQYLAKLGNGQYETNNGLANLWLNSFVDKTEKFEILYDLVIKENLADKDEKEISFKRTNEDNKFTNFREGDICVLYPRNSEEDNVTTNQVFKCTIKRLSKNEVVVSFRYKQRNTSFFDRYTNWALERDFMDISFSAMYRNLYAFLCSSQRKKDLILTQENPTQGNDSNYKNEELSEEQNRIIRNALNAKDYFLLNGPPGTGKTSIIVKELVRELYKNKNCNILLLAYTNRAVDELCEAVNNAIINFEDVNDGYINYGRTDRNFVRIGGELSCSQEHKHNLLNNIIESEAKRLEKNGEKFSRESIKNILEKHRVFISTVASISGKTDIFKLKKFDVIIVDEASQILEPQIVGILPKSDKFILIGDHKQLPAIVLQDPESSKTKNQLLEKIGLENRKNSIFERLYTFCESNNLDYAFDKLTYQGRMHKEIALFPSYNFYNSQLKEAYYIPNLLSDKKESLERQVVELKLKSPTKNTLSDLLSQKRLIFFQSQIDKDEHFKKSNQQEADLIIKIVLEIKNLYSVNSKPFDNKKTIGIITPFRNQIALIKQKLEEEQVPNFEEITVDTVERFQGSQRDIIIFSFAINNPYQLNGIVNLNDDGTVDRKLNVALTRAKEQLILVGNDSILSNNLVYYKLIEFIKSKGGYIWDSISDVLGDNLYFDYFDSIETVEGKTYTPDDEFKRVFDDLVINVLKNDSRTENYPEKILGVTNDFIRNNIIEYGRADFDSSYTYQYDLFTQEFTIKDKVNLYCFYNMRKHYFSGYAIFESFKDFFEIELKQTSGRLTFIDFGCGPLTSGLAFNQMYKSQIENFQFKYIGIDISKAMLEKAEEFSDTELFNPNSSFKFADSFKKVNKDLLNEWFRVSNVVVLNFSYLFANLDNDQISELAEEINTLMKEFPFNKYILIYQNPKNRHHNFTTFKKYLKHIEKTVVRNSETVLYKNSHQSWYDSSETFTYEIMTN